MDRALNHRDRSSVPEPELQKVIEDAERTVAERDGRRYLLRGIFMSTYPRSF